jgi:isoleucyl-tRNA synthetase
VADELNVLGFEPLAGELVDYSAKANFRTLGARFGKDTPRVAAAVAAANPEGLAAQLREDGRASIALDGDEVTLEAGDIVLTETPREGWAVISESGETVALDLFLTPELRRAGLSREVVRVVQEARKAAGLAVTDRISLRWQASGELAEALREHADQVAAEVLATSYTEVELPGSVPYGVQTVEELGLTFSIEKAAA